MIKEGTYKMLYTIGLFKKDSLFKVIDRQRANQLYDLVPIDKGMQGGAKEAWIKENMELVD